MTSGYVPSGCARPSRSEMTPEQRSFYDGWKAGADSGSFGETDDGYVWLYVSETINSPIPGRTMLKRLLSLHDGCPMGRRLRSSVADACLDVCMLNGLPVPSGIHGLNAEVREHRAVSAFTSDKIGSLTMTELSSLSKYPKDVYLDDTEACRAIMTESLRRIDKMLRKEGSSIEKEFHVAWTSKRKDVFLGFAYVGGRQAEYRRFIGPPTGLSIFLRDLERAVLSFERRGRHLNAPRVPATLDPRFADVVRRVTEEWIALGRDPEAFERPGIVLDLGKVAEAESALNDVTRMMSLK